MKKQFWLDKWQKKQTKFHYDSTNPLLKKYFPKFGLAHNDGVLLPLCGKTGDMKWLLEQKIHVIGVEIIREPLIEFLAENKIEYSSHKKENFEILKGKNKKITLYYGDFLEVTPNILPSIKCIYDRASLVALPIEIRKKYYSIIRRLLQNDTQYLLLTFLFDKALDEGPPFYVPREEVMQNLNFQVDFIEQVENIQIFLSNSINK